MTNDSWQQAYGSGAVLAPAADGLPKDEVTRRALDILTLKRARQQIAELRQTLDQYSTSLSYEAGSLSRKVDEQLAWLLLRRELEDEGGA